MQPDQSARRGWIQAAIAIPAMAALLLLYLVALRLTVDISRIDLGRSAEDRDTTYLWLHMAVLFVAVAGGFLIGKWLNGLGFAYALLFLFTIAAGMLVLQLASLELACHGHNDLVRHWQC